jgi:hypothetical protein
MSETEVRAGENICDFCSDPQIARYYECPDFVMDASRKPELRSKGAWAACATCASLIESGNWDRLLGRAVDAQRVKYPLMPRRILTDIVKRAQDLFREHYAKGHA